MTDNFWQAEARSEETKKFIKDIKPGFPIFTLARR
jgi:hypothetical protein